MNDRNRNLEEIKARFREGRRAEAIAECEALSRRMPADGEVKRLCANMHTVAGNFARSLEMFEALLAASPDDAELLFNAALCHRELNDFESAAMRFERHTQVHPRDAGGWAGLADCRLRAKRLDDAVEAAGRALALDAKTVPALVARGQAYEQAGRLEPAIADYTAALALAPADDATLKRVTTLLLELDRGEEAIRLCREVLKSVPSSITAKFGAEWLLSKMVPYWHVPMMNELPRNEAYLRGIEAAVTPSSCVFEIGTGSGLLAMMAARRGAAQVTTCEAVGLVARTAEEIVARNGLKDRVKVLSKPSYQVHIGEDLPAKADILVHEIFSSELLGEHVLPAIEDAKARLLKPGGTIIPGVASIMIALVGGEELGTELHVAESFGFDLSPFNAIQPKKRPIHREDLPRVLLSAELEAFRFDFRTQSTFPPELKRLQLRATGAGTCHGIIQWIRFDCGGGSVFENHPSHARPVASWQHTVYRFDEPVRLEAGSTVTIDAMHDRSRPWFEAVAA
jgi:tetratricopeptide (TPR) repeat protein